MEKQFTVTGLAPAVSKAANDFMKQCGLGGDGAFVRRAQVVILTLGSLNNAELIPEKLKQVYEMWGWADVSVSEND